ncbi:MAG TPA: TetR/AcrR family transcriptional regulator [Rhodobacterales bacterium]|nr:TetR/AcrR family transcriptional regulator [Rhodobacterales bacterium]
MSSPKPKRFKGDLRAALIEAGIDLVRDGGPEALTIRGVAARVGVSHAAPKHHFATLEALRTAIATEGYRRFTAEMDAAIAEATLDPQSAITAAGIGYIRFARSHPGLFQIMFTDRLDVTDPALCTASDAAYAVLARVAAPVAHGAAGAEGTETLIWSIAHGFSALMLTGKPELQDPAHAEALYRAIAPTFPLAPKD